MKKSVYLRIKFIQDMLMELDTLISSMKFVEYDRRVFPEFKNELGVLENELLKVQGDYENYKKELETMEEKCTHEVRGEDEDCMLSKVCLICGNGVYNDNVKTMGTWLDENRNTRYCSFNLDRVDEGEVRDNMDKIIKETIGEDVDFVEAFRRQELKHCRVIDKPRSRDSRVLITVGTTSENLDDNVKLTSISDVENGLKLVRKLLDYNTKVTLLANKSVTESVWYRTLRLHEATEYRYINVETTQDMLDALNKEKDMEYDMVVHTANTLDYSIGNITNLIDNNSIREKLIELLKMAKNELIVRLTPSDGILKQLRDIFPKSVLIGVDNVDEIPKEEALNHALNLCTTNNMDYVFVHGIGKNYLVDKSGNVKVETYTEENIYEELGKKLTKRK